MINNKKSPIIDPEMQEYPATKDVNLTATTDDFEASKDTEYAVISTPTNYDPEKTTLIQKLVRQLSQMFFQ
ncbi:hypothetical protein [Anaerosolibacter sp.]|jgi:UDPglucose 6-dehydrogenase|uniref:hypothetical protein n=1 Tax=Anaerosolibacter sp. TaxID=1872527 RepID=UPI003FA4A84C